MKLVFLGLSLSSSWGNGHATTYRGLLRALAARGHEVLFLEREQPWYAAERDLIAPDYCTLSFYRDLAQLADWRATIAQADAVILGSFVPEGDQAGALVQAWAKGVKAFYDIDTPVTLEALGSDAGCPYLNAADIRGYDLYLSFTGGPTLRRIEDAFGSPRARALYCSVDPDQYQPSNEAKRWDLSYLGTYSADRQPALEELMLSVATASPDRRFVVAGPQYPEALAWPSNVERIGHLPPAEHARFYSASRYTLNLTRADMKRAGWSPSVRLFEAASCATPVISDYWGGIEELFEPDREILIARKGRDVSALLESDGWQVGRAARRKVLGAHTAAHRARELEDYLMEARQNYPAIRSVEGASA